MKDTKKLSKEIENWINHNGACDIEVREENILLFNGGLFQDCNENYAELWIGDLNETIRYLRRLRDFLNKKGFNTGRNAQDFLNEKRRVIKRKGKKNG